ncbi:unnamed protein product [Vitrella brassicaformis CCMP3155]|uniref:t-SNARE coiled-coil homology domain-containing protein n=1 Tax=Vitrella brassicaformis (strain CCMP3155) TaxID=1169540 RepID=A0A0G4FLB7_VITBC|nr:unnamed protein product [Vitrella brassicaformis CCMP3155]|mmetsp:Transcript_20478/g.49842  ORF Transcript_20478/g.49842 Transcript_20478/m.49842 type:complete len:244 (-) Transcript_20478:320-1051(-)|eukprot:CEM14179.1 unnamed protein product [Vitrella brassicaformis CCMP3155]
MTGVTLVGASETFTSYEDDYHQLARDISQRISQIQTQRCGPAEVAETGDLLQDARSCLKHMELEVQSMPANTSLTNKVKRIRADLTDLSRDFDRVRARHQRDQLIGRGRYAADDTSASVPMSGGQQMQESSSAPSSHRARLLEGQDMLQDGTRRLEQSKRVALDTESVGINVMSDLKGQRETLMRTHQHVRDTDSNLQRAKRILRTMGRRALTNKVLLHVIIVLLLLAIVMTLVMKLTRTHRK